MTYALRFLFSQIQRFYSRKRGNTQIIKSATKSPTVMGALRKKDEVIGVCGPGKAPGVRDHSQYKCLRENLWQRSTCAPS